MPQQPSQEQFVDEISLHDFLVGLKRWITYLSNFWKVFALSLILSTGALYAYFQSKPDIYTAELTFMLNDDSGGQLSGVSGILGQLGLPIPSGKYNIDKLLDVSLSRSRIQEALFEKITINDREDYIINHMIEVYNLSKRWVPQDASFSDFQFTHAEFEQFNRNQNYALKSVVHMVSGSAENRGNALLQSSYGREAYIMNFTMSSLSEEISVEFVKHLFDKVESFYIAKATEKPQRVYESMKAKRDSLEKSWINAERQLARIKDSSFGSFGSASSVKRKNLETQVLIYKTGLAQAEQNLMIAEVSLSNSAPLIQKIDDPLSPLQPERFSYLRLFLFSIMLAVGISTFWIFIKEFIAVKID